MERRNWQTCGKTAAIILTVKLDFIIVSRCKKDDETAEEVQGTMKSLLLNSQRIGKHHADNEGEDEEKRLSPFEVVSITTTYRMKKSERQMNNLKT